MSGEADARVAARERIDLERQDQPHDGIGQRIADARGVREQQIALQQLELIGRDARLREQAEAGVDAVGGVAGATIIDQRGRGRDAFAVRSRERDRRARRSAASGSVNSPARISITSARSSAGSGPVRARSRSRSDSRRRHGA
jgi:hypothetical protein